MIRILDWERVFEVNRSRELKHPRWVAIPNRFDGEMIQELILRGGDGAYGCFVAMVLVSSTCKPRGTLRRKSGKSHSPATLSRATGLSESGFHEMIDLALDIGLAEADPAAAPQPPRTQPALFPQEGAATRQDRTGQDRTRKPTRCARSSDRIVTNSYESVADLVYAAYPRKRNPRAAKKAIIAAMKRDGGKHDILAKTREYAASPAGQKPPGDDDFRPYPASWYNAGGYLDDPTEWQKANGAEPERRGREPRTLDNLMEITDDSENET